MDLDVIFLGTAGSVPTARRGLPAALVRRGGERLLFDCGEGTQRQLVRSVGLAELDAVFLTHLHADHWLGLPGMLKSFELRDRERPLTVYGPPGTRAALERLRPVFGRPRFGLTFAEPEPDEALERDGYRIVPFLVRHRGRAYGYAIVEDHRPGRFDAARAETLGVRPGPDFGRLQRGEAVDGVSPDQVLGPDRPGRRVVLTGDTAPTDAVVVAAHGADVLVHEATFGDEDRERAAQTLHSTARQAATVAADAEVALLALTHLSSRLPARRLLEEAREVFPDTEVPRDFDAIDVPFPERGRPELVEWRRPAQPAEA